jgi:hypothetical protein
VGAEPSCGECDGLGTQEGAARQFERSGWGAELNLPRAADDRVGRSSLFCAPAEGQVHSGIAQGLGKA